MGLCCQRSVTMKKNLLGLGLVFFFVSKGGFAQGLGEYGRLLGGVSPKSGPAGSQGGGPGSVNLKAPALGVGPASNSMPSSLTVETESSVLYARSEEWADQMTQLSLGEKLVPMVHTAGANTFWYMVKT